MEYKECFETMGKDRNSYSKADLEATFMRIMLFAIGRNINKYHRFLHQKIKKFEGKKGQETA